MSLIPEGKPRGFCKCGCGQLLKTKGSRFLLGHSWRDAETKAKAIAGQQRLRTTTDFNDRHAAIIKSPEVRAKISKTLMGKKQSVETLQKRSQSMKQSWLTIPEGKRKERLGNFLSDETRARAVQTKTKMWHDNDKFRSKMLSSLCAVAQEPEVRARAAKTLRQNWAEHKPELLKKVNAHLHKPEIQAKARASFLLKKDEIDAKRAATLRTPEVRNKIAKSLTGLVQSEETKAKKSKALKGRSLSEKNKEGIRAGQKRFWAGLSDAEVGRRLRNSCNNGAKPTRPEVIVGKWLESHYPNEWRYNGDGAGGVVIGRHIPDFVNVNGRKMLIEVFGKHWHNPANFPNRMAQQELISHYKEWGFDCLVLWENEIYKTDVMEAKLREFIS